MKTNKYARSWQTCRSISLWIWMMFLALGGAWMMGRFYGDFATPSSQRTIQVDGLAVSAIDLAIR